MDTEDTIIKCEGCGEVKECSYGLDPFSSEILYDDTPMWLCDDCIEESQMQL